MLYSLIPTPALRMSYGLSMVIETICVNSQLKVWQNFKGGYFLPQVSTFDSILKRGQVKSTQNKQVRRKRLM